MNKKILLTTLGLSLVALAGCGNSNNGVFIAGNVASFNANSAQVNIDYVAALLNGKNKIVNLRLDTAQIIVASDAEGSKVVLDESIKNGNDGDIKSKWERLEGYGMGAPAEGEEPAVEEWYIQAEKFEKFAVGKTVEELKAAVGEDATLTDKANIGVTIHVNSWIDAISHALTNKVNVTNVDKLSLGVGGINTLAAKQANYTIGAAALTADKKVAAARFDVYQAPYEIIDVTNEDETVTKKVQIATTGAYGPNKQVDAAKSTLKSKHDLLEGYGMAAPADGDTPAIEEWYVQANKIAAFLKGKTITEGLALSTVEGRETYPADAKALGATIKIVDYRNALLEAENTAFNPRYTAK